MDYLRVLEARSFRRISQEEVKPRPEFDVVALYPRA